MKARGSARVCLFIGTLLVALVLASPFVFSVLSLINSAELAFDYLMTAELGFLALIALVPLLVGTFLSKSPYLLCVISSALLVISLVTLMLLSDPPIIWAVLVLVLYNLSLLLLLLHGFLSLK